MNVQPGITEHPKFRQFKRTLGVPEALEYLVRLWAHCQGQKRGAHWGKVGADYVEAVCQWPGSPGTLFAALVKPYGGRPGFISVSRRDGVTVTAWEEHNSSLVRCWANGDKGGRPGTNPRQTHGKPHGHPYCT